MPAAARAAYGRAIMFLVSGVLLIGAWYFVARPR
jgi:hypothetical protein